LNKKELTSYDHAGSRRFNRTRRKPIDFSRPKPNELEPREELPVTRFDASPLGELEASIETHTNQVS